MVGITIKYRIKDFQNSTYKKCSPLISLEQSLFGTGIEKIPMKS